MREREFGERKIQKQHKLEKRQLNFQLLWQKKKYNSQRKIKQKPVKTILGTHKTIQWEWMGNIGDIFFMGKFIRMKWGKKPKFFVFFSSTGG